MARQATITNEQILNAARDIFLEEGFGVATSKVALRAGVSEGTIFKRFQTKEALFAAALDIEYPPLWHRLTEEQMAAGDTGDAQDIRERLSAVMLALFSFHLDSVPRMLGRLGHPPGADGPGKHPMGELLMLDMKMLSQYLDREISLGRLRTGNTSLLASLIIGSMIDRSIRATVEHRSLSTSERRKIVQDTLAILWDGIAPP